MVAKGDTCDVVASKNGITTAQVIAWNTGVGASCSGLWADTYACVSIIGHTPGPTTTKPANGVTTPSPIQSGMVTNCKKFHFVKKGEFCAVIAAAEGVSVANIVKWNPAVGNDCASMWAETYLCVGVL
ncbi:LysM domain-containing protein [Lasiosphaeris hirsuta]|uniref:LysM domain-containing protein n=1 Tax=Lasiosphaeris hirsuta TaxID=260670 RepID=A0AA39ZWQ6_9PEZI|nr:LysM domain-containing protein [Lasiosphaeris hirsuta]